jgi:hypothetical protein
MKFEGVGNSVPTPGNAVYVEDIAHPGKAFPCPSGIIGGELVPVGDRVDIYWSGELSTGPQLIITA